MKKITFFLLFISSIGTVNFANAQIGIITTVAGNGYTGFGGDGGPATSANIYKPWSVAVDIYNNVYIADLNNNCIRKVNSAGVITTFAGTGIYGFSGDGGAATAANLNTPNGVSVDNSGNVYIADDGNVRIRKVNLLGIISTIAGNGIMGFSGDGWMATAAKLNQPYSAVADNAGNVYIADYGNNRIRKVDTFGVITTFAGTDTAGFGGDGGVAISANLHYPDGIAVDNIGNVYIVDGTMNNRIRKVNSAGIISTIAGCGLPGFSGDGGAATLAGFDYPNAVAVDNAGNIYIADILNQRIRSVNSSGIINTVAGNGTSGFSGDYGAATMAKLNNPSGIAVDNFGNLYIADALNNRIRKVSCCPTGIISQNLEITRLKIYPNPTTSQLTIKADVSNYHTLTITDIVGQQILQQSITSKETIVDVQQLPTGIYYITFTGEKGNELMKFVKW